MQRRLLFTIAVQVSIAIVGAFSNFGCSNAQRSASARPSLVRPVSRHHAPLATAMKVSVKDMIDLDDSNYREVLRGEKPVLIDAHAPWCGPCRLLEPVVERSADKWKGVDFVRYDVDSGNNAELKTDLLLQDVAITSLPALILFMDGKHIASRSGLIGDLELNIWLSSSLHKGRSMSELAEEEEDLVLTKSSRATECVGAVNQTESV